MLSRRWFLVFAVVFALAIGPVRADDNEFTLTILHDNDLHGHLLPFAYTETGRSADEMSSVGGAARRATLIRRLREAARNPVFLVDSGDTFTRGAFTNAYEGIADAEAMNAVGYELAALGNNEFKAKDGIEINDAPGAQAALLRIIKRSRFPWVCANVTDDKGAYLEGVQPFVVRQFGPLRVGFLGLTAPRSGKYPQTKGWHFADPITAAKDLIPKARAQCDVLIAVTHIGVDLDQKLASETMGLDAIVGGDSHTFLYQSLEVKNPSGTMVPIVQDGEFGVNLGKFDLHFSRDSKSGWHLAGYRYGLLPVGPNLPEAPDVVRALQPFVAPLMTVVGTLPADRIGKADDRSRLSTQVLVDALRHQLAVDVAMNPEGVGFFGVFRAPTVRRYDIYDMLPFHNNAAIATMTGAELQKLLDRRKNNVVSGDVSALDPAKSYRVALVDFVAQDTQEGYGLPSGTLTNTGRDIRDLVMAEISHPNKP